MACGKSPGRRGACGSLSGMRRAALIGLLLLALGASGCGRLKGDGGAAPALDAVSQMAAFQTSQTEPADSQADATQTEPGATPGGTRRPPGRAARGRESPSPTTWAARFPFHSPGGLQALIGSFADVWCRPAAGTALWPQRMIPGTQFDLKLPDTVKNLGAVKRPAQRCSWPQSRTLCWGAQRQRRTWNLRACWKK